MPRRRRSSKTDDPFGPTDFHVFDLIQNQNAILRAALCTLARHGVAFRRDEPERAAGWIDQLSSHPFYKGGQFLFDLLEWEDFMLDGPPPPLLDRAKIVALLERIAAALSSVQGQLVDFKFVAEPIGTVDDLPLLESGFYLYRDVILGVLRHILQSSNLQGGSTEKAAPMEMRKLRRPRI
jgi:hypothetical protein